MSDTKPLEAIVGYVRSVKEANAEQAAAEQLASAIERVYAQVDEMAILCKRYGKANLLARFPAELRPVIEGTIAGIKQSWEAMSPMPFPAMPDEPVAAEAPADLSGTYVQARNEDGAKIGTGTGTALTAQGVADALKLAPTAGAPATGSVYDSLTSVGVDPQDVADALKLAPGAGTPATGSVYDLLTAMPDQPETPEHPDAGGE